jgi:hypothetical protein
MKVKNITRRTSSLVKGACAIALMCVGMHTASAQLIQMDEEVSRPAEELIKGQTVYTQPQGTTQMILSGSQIRSGDMRDSRVSARAEYGVTDRLQLQAEVPLDITDRSSNFTAQSGVSHVSGGATYRFTGIGSPVAVAAGMDVDVPLAKATDVTGDRPASGPMFKPSLIMATGSGAVTVHGSAQAELGEPTRALNYSLGSQYDLGNWVPSLELNSRAIENASPEFYATPGVTYKFSDRTQLGVGAAIGLNDQSNTAQIIGKFSMSLGQ